MFGGIGPWEIILLLLLVLLIFGAKRLPELGGALGKGIREFRQSVKEIGKDDADKRGELSSGDRPGETRRPENQTTERPRDT